MRYRDPIARTTAAVTGLPLDAARLLSQHGTPVDVAAGKVLCHEGDLGREAFVLLTGQATVLTGDGVVQVGPGSVVGELAALDPSATRNATVVADGDALVLVFDTRTFRALASEPVLRAFLRPVHEPVAA